MARDGAEGGGGAQVVASLGTPVIGENFATAPLVIAADPASVPTRERHGQGPQHCRRAKLLARQLREMFIYLTTRHGLERTSGRPSSPEFEHSRYVRAASPAGCRSRFYRL
jgi:hypothetical protein